jgi:hypothetical protein
MYIYSARAEERRRQFNKIIDGINMVLMNNISEIDPSVYENWDGLDPMGNDDCNIEQISEDGEDDGLTWFRCDVHGHDTLDEYSCEGKDWGGEVMQWFAVSDNDADFLKRHGQYITYSDMLDTSFLAILHFGTSWDYTGMVDDFDDCYHGLENFDDQKEVV